MPRWAWVTIGVVVAAVAAGCVFAYAWDRSQRDVIARGVRIAGVDVGGLHAREARAVVEQRIVSRLDGPLLLRADGRSMTLRPASVGLSIDADRMVADALRAGREGGIVARIVRAVRGSRVAADVPLRAGVPRRALSRAADTIVTAFSRPARAARVVPTPTRLRVIPEQTGVAVQRAVLVRTLATALVSMQGPHTLAVPTRVVEPQWTVDSLGRRYPSYILVDREHFVLRLYRHLRLARTYPIAVGRQGLETPAGLYRIDDKQVDPSWHVPLSAWAGDLAGKVIPPGPADPIKARWMGFHDGAGIHGTDESSSIGSAASHGCIRMRIDDVIALYPLVPLHTPIYVG